METTDVGAEITAMGKELKSFTADVKASVENVKASVEKLNSQGREAAARLLGIEQHIVAGAMGGNASQSQEAAGEKAPVDSISGLAVLSLKHRCIDNLPPSIERKGLSLSKFLRGVVTGLWTNAAEERKSLDETTLPGGGYLLVPELSAQFIDIMRAQTRCVQAGAVTIPMATSQLRVPVLNTDVSTAWKTELATIQVAAPDFGQVLAQAHTLAGYIPTISVELFEDSDLVTQMITQAFTRSMAVAVDAAALTGTGAPGPTGLKSNVLVAQTPVAGGPLSSDELSLAVANIRGRNYQPNAYIVGPWGAGELARAKAVSSGVYLGRSADVAPLAELVTTSAGGDVFLGDFTRMAFFPRTGVTIEISRVGDGTAWSKLAVSIRAYLRLDVAATEPRAFQILVGYGS
jgi:HK97 family phage major capsid protein